MFSAVSVPMRSMRAAMRRGSQPSRCTVCSELSQYAFWRIAVSSSRRSISLRFATSGSDGGAARSFATWSSTTFVSVSALSGELPNCTLTVPYPGCGCVFE